MEVEKQSLDSAFPFWKPIPRSFRPDSPFFAPGNLERELLARQVALELTEEKEQLENWTQEEASYSKFIPLHLCGKTQFYWCYTQALAVVEEYALSLKGSLLSIVGCGARLTSTEDFENHYNARHTASCSVCSIVYPTSRLLSIHVSEVHDSFFKAKVARGYDMYECLVEGCGLKFKSYNSRKQHLVDKHKFPTSFEFYKKARPSKKQRLKSLRKQAAHKEDASGMMEVENAAIDDLVSAVSKLNTSDSTPSSISFGRRNKGLSFVPQAVQHGRGSNSGSPIPKR